jgi:hypothetical protein
MKTELMDKNAYLHGSFSSEFSVYDQYMLHTQHIVRNNTSQYAWIYSLHSTVANKVIAVLPSLKQEFNYSVVIVHAQIT